MDANNVKYFGGLRGDETVYYTKLGGTELVFISYNQFGGESAKVVAEKIAKESSLGKKVIVYAHWGEEYIPPPESVKNTAKLFAESGAELIVGSHPHVVLETENIGETEVYYSLGNFMFDQYWNEDVTTGLALELNIKNGRMSITEHKVRLERDGRTCLMLMQ